MNLGNNEEAKDIFEQLFYLDENYSDACDYSHHNHGRVE